VASTALVIWLLTALIGLYMFGMSIGIGRPAGERASTHWPSWLMFLHPTMAVAGVVIWIIYMSYGYQALAWLAFADLILVAALGDVLLLVWLKDRRSEQHPQEGQVKRVKNYVPRPRQGRAQHQAPETVAVTELDERRIPPIAVTTHGILAVLTIVLVLLAALGVGS
jgi:manganese efflux pump family protein